MGITPMGAERLLSRGCPAHLPGSDGPRALISTGSAIGLLEYRTATFAPKLPRVHTFTEGGETPSDRRGCVGNHRRAQESARVLKGEAEVAVGSWSTRLGGGGAAGAGRGRDGAPAHRPPGAGQLGTRFSVHNQVEPRGAFWAGAGRLPGADAARAQRRRLSPQAYDQEPRATALRADRADTAPFHIRCHLVPTCVA